MRIFNIFKKRETNEQAQQATAPHRRAADTPLRRRAQAIASVIWHNRELRHWKKSHRPSRGELQAEIKFSVSVTGQVIRGLPNPMTEVVASIHRDAMRAACMHAQGYRPTGSLGGAIGWRQQ